MSEPNIKLRSLVDQALSALPHEIGCDDCFDYLAVYAEHSLRGEEVPAALRPVAEHLERCAFCVEELNLLLLAMREESSLSG